MAGEHITRADDPTLLPLARSSIKAVRASGLKWGSKRLVVGRAIVTAQVKGRQDYISVEGYSGDPIAMDSGIIDVGAFVITYAHGERYLPGQRRYIPAYEHIFNLRIGNTPWYVHLATAGQIAGTIALGTRVTGSVRKDDVTAAYSPRTYPAYDSEGNFTGRVDDGIDERLVDKKRAGVYCPASMFTGRTRLYVQAMYGRPLYTRQGDEAPDEIVSTPAASLYGAPSLLLSGYVPSGDRVTVDFNSGVYFDPVSKKHWLMNPAHGSITIYPLIADELGERARRRLTQNKLNAEDTLHLETYVLSSCRPDIENAVTLTILEVVPWASGYGWHWNWSGTTADIVRVEADTATSAKSTHYRLSVTATYDPEYDPSAPENDPNSSEYVPPPPGRIGDTTWEATAFKVSGPHRFMMQTPACCITHPNWLDRYMGFEPEHEPQFWSEKLTVNHNDNEEMEYTFPATPIYAFYNKDELQLAELSFEITTPTPPTLDASPGYVDVVDAENASYFLRRSSIGNDSAYLHHYTGVSLTRIYTLTCGGQSITVKNAGASQELFINDTAKTVISGPPPIAEAAFEGLWDRVSLRWGRPLPDGSYTTTTAYAEVTYGPSPQYSISQFTSSTYLLDNRWWGTGGGIIPFYDAETFYLIQDIRYEKQVLGKMSRTVSGRFIGHDGGKLVNGGVASYYGWSTFELMTSGTEWTDWVIEPNELTLDPEEKKFIVVSSCGTASRETPPGSAYAMFDDGDADYIGEKFTTIGSAGLGAHFRGLFELNWPDMPGMRNPVIVGWA